MSDKLMEAKEASEYTGVSTPFLKNQAKLGQVGYVMPSPKRIMFRKSDLDTWMSSWIVRTPNISG